MVTTRSETRLAKSTTGDGAPTASAATTSRDADPAPAAAPSSAPIPGPSGEPPNAPSSAPGPAPAVEPPLALSVAPAHSTSSRISRSSATVAARKLAAEAQHARHLAQLELEAKRVELERNAAELELRAQLAAIEAQSQRGSVSGRDRDSVKRWVQSTGEHSVTLPRICGETFVQAPTNHSKSPFAGAMIVQQQNEPHSEQNNVFVSPQMPKCDDDKATRLATGADQVSMTRPGRDSYVLPDTFTPATYNPPGGVETISTLLNTFQRLVDRVQPNKNNKVNISLPTFDGKSPIDWLVFKRSYCYSQGSFTAAENLARLSVCLTGVARDAVRVLLATAQGPDIVLQELDRRFGRPEQIVMREVNIIRALPKVNMDLRDLSVFASRVRNCVEVVKLLDETDYLRSPELFGALISKLHPLLRARWLDYAAAACYASNAQSSSAKVELLSEFLSREVDLLIKFDTPAEPPPAPRERAHAVSESDFKPRKDPNSGGKPKNINNNQNNVCAFCKQSHHLASCDNFKNMTVDDRWHFIKENKICYRCLQGGSHSFRLCTKNKIKCEIEHCHRKHHTLLHNPNFLPPSAITTAHVNSSIHDIKEEIREVTAHTSSGPCPTDGASCGPTRRPLLKIAAVTVTGPTGSVDTFALLDDGSTSTFIDSDISTRIGATGPEKQIHLDCVGGLYKETSVKYVDFEIKGRYSTESFSVHSARSIKNLGLSCKQTVRSDDLIRYPYLSEISSELCYENAIPTIVIGIDNWHLSVASATIHGTKSQPVAIRTVLGWVLFGFSSSWTRPVEFLNHVSARESDNCKSELEELVKSQYKLDAIGITKHETRSSEDQRALHILESTARRLPSGRFEVGLLWNAENIVVPDSYPLALSRFRSLERKMSKEPAYADRYRQNIQDTLSKGYAEECTGVAPTGIRWYLPHFGVINPNKPGKLRVVHDAAACSSGVSLNSLLLTGPDLLQSQLSILMRFREGRIALTADVKEMFPQIKIIPQDRDAQRFLWRDDPSGPIKTYRMSSMIFGACSSPSTAIYIMNLNASEFQKEFPESTEVIKRDTYMDDLITSTDSVEDAARLATEVVTISKRGGFEMRGWTTNERAAVATLPIELLSDVVNNQSPDVNLCKNLVSRTLGLIWQPFSDELAFNSGLSEESWAPVTKRQALTQVMRIYDPLGILAPIVVKGRILFQILWRKGLDWDERLCVSDCEVWHEWFVNLKAIAEIRIPRHYNLNNKDVAERELHVFCDASELAYVAVAYWRFVDVCGRVSLALVASKVRVAPLKPISIPRLELQGALVASRLAAFICESHRIKPNRRYFWCDSMTVLGWLRSDARKYKPFVANRVGEITENSVISEWRWVPTELNVADDATRLKCSSLNRNSRWISGPEYLLTAPTNWPSEPTSSSTDDLNEMKPSARLTKPPSARLEPISSPNRITCHYNVDSVELPAPVVADPTHFSSWLRLLRATARAHHFIAACIIRVRGVSHNFILPQRNPSTVGPRASLLRPLDLNSLALAELHVLRQSQRNTFDKEIQCLQRSRTIPSKSRILDLSPVLNQDGLLCMEGRTTAVTDVENRAIRPIILDGRDPAVRLLIAHVHRKFAHASAEAIVNELRQQYWILSIRNSARSIIHRCQFCKLVRGKPLQPPMGDLPQARLSHHRRPFTFVGLDYFGPLQVMVRRRQEKRWVALFTCLTTRAIHLEVVHSLSADAAIMCLRRFAARRGTPSQIFSDNGTAFVGANRQLRTLYQEDVIDYASNAQIKWSFIPPSAPFMGGAWERLVRSVKTALRVTLRERTPSEEVFTTLLVEAEAIVNARPLTHVPPDAADPEALTPNHFLLGSSSGQPFPAEVTDSDLCSRSGWRRALRLADHFWRRWVREHLPTLAPRRTRGSSRPDVKVGDPVLVADGDLPRGTWPRGVISGTFPGRDGIVRVVDVRTAAGILRRPLKKVVPL